MRQSTQTAIAVLVVVALAIGFWLLFLGPKRDKVGELSDQAGQLSSEVATERARSSEGVAAKERFPDLYRQLVLLGKAVPAEAATPSLMVQLNTLGKESSSSFTAITLGEGEEAGATGAALLPIGASIGPTGLPAMPYALEYRGGFFGIADFLEGLDEQVETRDGEVVAKGRLVTIDSFTLEQLATKSGISDDLEVDFHVTTYLTPPDQGLTAGATVSGPEGAP